mgnify:CR=1 FL=1
MNDRLLQVRGLTRDYALPSRTGFGRAPRLTAVAGVDLIVEEGQSFAIVGESGCGKSTLARLVVALDRPTAGQVLFRGRDLATQSRRDLKALRRHFQMVFQDPYDSLDPRLSVGRIVVEPLHLAEMDGGARQAAVHQALEDVGLKATDAGRYPHEFSGGQRQRIAIARALIGRPSLIVADEPVSALDLSVQAQVLNLLLDLQARHGLAYLLISHNLAVVEQVSRALAVMYLGRFVETGPTAEIFRAPAHPYTRMLLDAVPRLDPRRRPAARAIADMAAAPAGACPFMPRCPLAADACRTMPPLREIAPGRKAACHFV